MKQYFLTFLKGMGMGAADIVPGVSGGTIAFITGVYEDLLAGIKNLGGPAWLEWKSNGFQAFAQSARLGVLIPLFLGIGVSIASLAKAIQYALSVYPLLTWSFFFGLILASSVLVMRKIKTWTVAVIALLLLGFAIAFQITRSVPVSLPEGNFFIFLSGFIAISAMILPGISGSFILLLLGKYETILQAVTSLQIGIIILFAVGCGLGLLVMANVLTWLLNKYHDAAVGLLSGFMIGALYKVWPWKKVLQTRINSKGIEVPFIERSIWPTEMQSDPMIFECFIFFIIGAALVITIEVMAAKLVSERGNG
ncbi:MAG: DUF368 domain-containing protein [Thermaurantimonas sp.]|uniref:DUF368 domain-containing protein n=1 Tax=Thermaurantimonas sp. TaxID=2681568 RepID=UPI00391BB4AB